MKQILFLCVLAVLSSQVMAQTKAALFNSSVDYMAFIESHPHIRVIAVTTMVPHGKSPETSKDSLRQQTQLVVTYEESSR